MTESAYLQLLKLVLVGLAYGEPFAEVTAAGRGPLMAAKRLIVRQLSRRGFRLLRHGHDRERGGDWPAAAYTMIGLRRLENVQQLIETALADAVPGDVAECGVWRGGCAMLMRATLKEHGSDRRIWVADSFEGMPKPDVVKHPIEGSAPDMSGLEYLSVSLDRVKDNFRRFGLLDEQVRFLKGWFSETLPKAPIQHLAVLRADGDLYESTMDILTNLYDKVSPRGFVIIDDYGSWPPCRQAVDEFRLARRIGDPLVTIDADGVYWRKSHVATPSPRSLPARARP